MNDKSYTATDLVQRLFDFVDRLRVHLPLVNVGEPLDLTAYRDDTVQSLQTARIAFSNGIHNSAVTSAYEALIEHIRTAISNHPDSRHNLRSLYKKNDAGVIDIAVSLNIIDTTEKDGLVSLKKKRELSTHRSKTHKFSPAETASFISEVARMIEAIPIASPSTDE